MSGLAHRLENLLLAASLAALVVLGVASASTAFVGADELNRHLTLLIGMLGGMGTVVQSLPASWRPWVGLFAGAVATTVTALLTLAAWQFVREEAAVSSTLAFGVPRIALQRGRARGRTPAATRSHRAATCRSAP